MTIPDADRKRIEENLLRRLGYIEVDFQGGLAEAIWRELISAIYEKEQAEKLAAIKLPTAVYTDRILALESELVSLREKLEQAR